MKTLSSIGLSWFLLSLICIIGSFESGDIEGTAVSGILGMFYAIPLAIVGYVKSIKPKMESSVTKELLKLNELKEKGVLSEDEFQAIKIDLLKK